MNKSLFLSSKVCYGFATVVAAGLMMSCAQDGYDDDERFESSVKGASLTSPAADAVTVTASADGKTQTITWPVVKGAGGYLFSFYDEGNLDEPIVKDSVIDGCSVTVPREEDMNYRIDLSTLGNAKLGNAGASAATQMSFSTFTAAYAAIPGGTDLCQYFQENPVPETDEAVYYDLEPNGSYSLPTALDFGCRDVVLRTTSKTDYATITYGEKGSIEYCGGLTLKYLNLDCSASSKPTLAFSANPPEDILDADNNNHYQITSPTAIMNCNITGVKGMLLFDNKVKYCLKTFIMENCLVHLESEGMTNSSIVYIYDGGGFINDFTMRTSTVWNSGDDFKYLIRYNNSGRCDRAGYATNSINMLNCTMYNLCKGGQMANHSGFDGRATSNFDIEDNIFVDCGSGQVPRRIIGRRGSGDITFNHNTYWFDGAPELEGAPDAVEGAKSEYDDSHSALQTDPAFDDAANGNFRPTGAEQVAYCTGDPRWLAD